MQLDKPYAWNVQIVLAVTMSIISLPSEHFDENIKEKIYILPAKKEDWIWKIKPDFNFWFGRNEISLSTQKVCTYIFQEKADYNKLHPFVKKNFLFKFKIQTWKSFFVVFKNFVCWKCFLPFFALHSQIWSKGVCTLPCYQINHVFQITFTLCYN